MIELHCGDCLDILSTLEAGSVDAVITDPPYFRVKGDEWDNQWKSEAAFLDWIGQLCREWKRVLKPNGSLFCFASTQMSWGVEGAIRQEFNVLNNIRWEKQEGWHNKADEEALRSYLSPWEAIIFAEQCGADDTAMRMAGYDEAATALHKDVYAPLGRYIQQERERAGLTRNAVEVSLGFVSGSDPTRGTALCYRWEEGSSLPTKETYEQLRQLLNRRGGEYLRREYEELKQECASLRQQFELERVKYNHLKRDYEDLRRPFDLNCNLPRNDIWRYKTVLPYAGKHPCEKPISMMIHMVEAVTREGGTVLDCFMGSGSTGVACARTGRRFIGIEKDAGWFKVAQKRIHDAQQQLELIA